MAGRAESVVPPRDTHATGRSHMTQDETPRRRPLPLRAAVAAARWSAKSTRDFLYRSLHLTLYAALAAGVAVWAVQLPAVKGLLKQKVAHARDKYVLDGDGGSSGKTPADLQA